MKKITIMEPLVTNLWKGSIRDVNYKSNFLCWDGIWNFQLDFKNISNIFVIMNPEDIKDEADIFYPYVEVTLVSARLHCQYA